MTIKILNPLDCFSIKLKPEPKEVREKNCLILLLFLVHLYSFFLLFIYLFYLFICFILFIYLFITNSDGVLGVCRLADVHHRLSRAISHDDEQISQWLTHEKERILSCEMSITNRQEQLLKLQHSNYENYSAESSMVNYCYGPSGCKEMSKSTKNDDYDNENGHSKNPEKSGEIEIKNTQNSESSTILSLPTPGGPQGLIDSMCKLRREMTVRSKKLLEAEIKENEARKVRSYTRLFSSHFSSHFSCLFIF